MCCENLGSDSVVLGWGSRFCISDEVPGNADARDPGARPVEEMSVVPQE